MVFLAAFIGEVSKATVQRVYLGLKCISVGRNRIYIHKNSDSFYVFEL